MIITTGPDTIDVGIDLIMIAIVVIGIGIVILTTDIVETDFHTGVIKPPYVCKLFHAGATTQGTPA